MQRVVETAQMVFKYWNENNTQTDRQTTW